jgi:hypothetical protein
VCVGGGKCSDDILHTHSYFPHTYIKHTHTHTHLPNTPTNPSRPLSNTRIERIAAKEGDKPGRAYLREWKHEDMSLRLLDALIQVGGGVGVVWSGSVVVCGVVGW